MFLRDAVHLNKNRVRDRRPPLRGCCYAVAMPGLTEQAIGCPYCGETISILVDDSLPQQEYVEDCQVCCRPIVLRVAIADDGDVAVEAGVENG